MSSWYAQKNRDILSAITHPSRAAILEFLAQQDFGTNKALRQYIRKLQSKTGGASPSVITHHVSLLEKAGLIRHAPDDPRIITLSAFGRRAARALRQLLSESDSGEVWDRSL